MTDWNELIENFLASGQGMYSSDEEDGPSRSPIKQEGNLSSFPFESSCSASYAPASASAAASLSFSDLDPLGISPHSVFDTLSNSSGPQECFHSARPLTRTYSNHKYFEGASQAGQFPGSRESTLRSPDCSTEEQKETAKRTGRKKGSSIQCDEKLIMRLLPLSTKRFNQEIKTLSLGQEEVKKLKFARRRIKNARAAQKRRSKLSENLDDLRHRVQCLTQENLDLNHRLKEVMEENLQLRRSRNNEPFPLDQYPQLR